VHDNGLADPAEAMAGNLHQIPGAIVTEKGEKRVGFYVSWCFFLFAHRRAGLNYSQCLSKSEEKDTGHCIIIRASNCNDFFEAKKCGRWGSRSIFYASTKFHAE
jgi:hypothetical protein